MPVKYSIENKGGFALVTACGEIASLKHALEYAESCIRDITRLGLRKVLIDDREVLGSAMSFFDSYELATFMERAANLRQVKLALVVPPQRTRSVKDLETIIRNRGFSFLGFNSVVDARDWLMNDNLPKRGQKQSLIKKSDCANYS